MTRDNLLFAIIGILLGFIAGFLLAGNITQRDAAQRAAVTSVQGSQNLPPNHPPVGGDQAAGQGAAGQGGQQMLETVQVAMKQARENPNDFDAQVKAADMEYQIQRFDQAIEYLLAANKVKPDDAMVLAMLGQVNMDAKHYDAALKWYKAALTKKPDDETTLDGYCFVLLQTGDAKAAEQSINKLAKLNSSNPDLAQFRSKLDELKSAKK
jgi:tetratricopeptide (TPR) repeat protein